MTATKAPPRRKKTRVAKTERGSAASSSTTSSAHLTVRPIGKYERLAYERQQRDLMLAYGSGGVVDESLFGDPSKTSHPKGYWYDPESGERPVIFIEHYCKHHKGEWAGQPFILADWQKFCIRTTYGWLRQDGTRRFRISYREVPRKNGKTEQAAGEGTFLFVADDEPGAEIYSTATKEDQAKIVWAAAKEMVKQSPDLKRFIVPRIKTLFCERAGATFKPLGSDSNTLDGLNPSGHVCDEMHAHKKRGVWDVMITAMGARRQPLTIVITTAGVYDPESIGWELHTHAQQVLDGVIDDDTFFAIIFAADDGDDPYDPATWWKANPNMDISVKKEYLAEQADRARHSPSFLNTFLRLHLNIWTQQVTKWIPIEAWNACRSPALVGLKTFKEVLHYFRGRRGYFAADLSSKIDMTSLAGLLPAVDEPDAYDAFWRFYVPQELVRRRTIDHKLPDYDAWVKNGWLVATPGAVIDYDFILKDILAIREQITIVQFGFDPWNASQFMIDMQNAGFTTEQDATQDLLVEMRQGYATLSEPSKELEKLTISRKIRHGDNPIMRWMMDNAVITRDANENIRPDKKSATGKIDGVLSSIMALGRAILRPQLVASVYETRGVRAF